MMIMPESFVSISGVTEMRQLDNIGVIYLEEGFNFSLVIGYQFSNNSINRGTRNVRQPIFEKFGELSEATSEYGFTAAVHYYTKDNATILGDLESIIGLGVDPLKTIVQLNTLPTSVDILARVKDLGFRIIFKVAVSDKKSSKGGYAVWKGEGVEDVSSGQIEPLIEQVWQRKNFIDYVMFDPSHGTNLDLDLNEKSLAVRLGKAVIARPELRDLGLVYAGGVKPMNVAEVTRTLRGFFRDRFSIDTESGVRIDDELNLDLVREYLTRFNAA